VPKKIPDCVEFGKTIRKLRSEQGYSQEAFARKAGIHRTYLGGLERGERNPTLRTIGKIAKELGLSIEDLFRATGTHE